MRAAQAGGALCLVAAVLAACTSSQQSGPAAKADQALATSLHRLVGAHGGPLGAIVVVQRQGTVVVDSVGKAVQGSSGGPRADDHVRIASVAKAFSGATALSLVAEGTLSLDETIGQVLPSLPADWQPVTLAQLLNHTSGLPDFSASPAFRQAVGASPAVAPPPAQLLTYVEGEPLLFAPGTRYAYSNSDNVVVALMVQAVANEPYESVLKKKVLNPLGLAQTSLPTGTSVPAPTVHGYQMDDTGAWEDVTTTLAAGWSWASGGVVSTPADANRFIRAYARGATTDGAAHARQFTFIQGAHSEPPGPGANSAGLAIFRYKTRCGDVYGHTGNTLGYTQFVAASADGSRSLSVSVNAQITPQRSPQVFPLLRDVFTTAACAALAH